MFKNYIKKADSKKILLSAFYTLFIRTTTATAAAAIIACISGGT